MSKAKILVVSDLHHGSNYGMIPPDFTTEDGREILPNVGQRYLWDCWEDLSQWAAPLGIDAIVFNGDCIDGKQPKSKGGELCLTLMSEQSKAASTSANFLKKSCGDPAVYVIKGTPYHAGECGDDEQRFASNLNAGSALDYLDLDIDGVIINFLHGIGGGALYKAAGADREVVFAEMASNKSIHADCLVRSHVHSFVHVEYPAKHIVVTPCFQLASSHAKKSSAYKFLPDIGAVLIEVDSEMKRLGGDPITITKRTYELPPMTATKFEVRA